MEAPSRPGPAQHLRGALRWILRPALVIALVLGGLYLVITPRVAEHFVFFPSRHDPGPAPILVGVEGEDVTIATSDGIRIHGWWHQVPGDAPVVLFFHGNAGTIGERIPLAQAYLARGVSILMVEYRGYGRSEGRPSESGVYRDAEAALAWLLERGVPASRIVVHGRSLGGAVGARLVAGRDDLAGIILESTFTSLNEIAAAAYPFLPSFLFRRLRGSFDNRARVRELRIPLLVVHGSRDRLVPPAMGRELYETAPEPRRWFEIRGADHNNAFSVGGAPYFDRLSAFVLEVAGGSSGSRSTGEEAGPSDPD
jgi:uncharacterized protein